MFQLKSTTVVGSTMTALYFVTLTIFVPWTLGSVALAITIGGGLIFGSGCARHLPRPSADTARSHQAA
ncbi:MAG: hypothetical protein U0936_17230 [Planctomycetaceae bacterium]